MQITASRNRPGEISLRTALLLTIALMAMISCTATEPEPATQAVAATTSEPLRLYVMDCGELTLSDVSPFNLSAEEAGTDQLFVPCYLIDHPDGQLVWDLGLPLTMRDQGAQLDGGTVKLERSVVEQMATLNLTPADVEYVAFSHLHFDHCGQAADFTSSHHLIQRAEHEAAFVEEPQIFGFQTELYMPLADSQTTLLDGDHDVFGDGRVVIKSAPGHTPGHQVLFVDLNETGPLLLSGDLYHFPANRELRRPPLFNFDAEMTLSSMTAIEQFLTESGATLWIEHNAELASTLKKMPEYYQ